MKQTTKQRVEQALNDGHIFTLVSCAAHIGASKAGVGRAFVDLEKEGKARLIRSIIPIGASINHPWTPLYGGSNNPNADTMAHSMCQVTDEGRLAVMSRVRALPESPFACVVAQILH
jgi:hypothetical protein